MAIVVVLLLLAMLKGRGSSVGISPPAKTTAQALIGATTPPPGIHRLQVPGFEVTDLAALQPPTPASELHELAAIAPQLFPEPAESSDFDAGAGDDVSGDPKRMVDAKEMVDPKEMEDPKEMRDPKDAIIDDGGTPSSYGPPIGDDFYPGGGDIPIGTGGPCPGGGGVCPPVSVPEPGVYLLLVGGLGVLFARRQACSSRPPG